MSGTNSTRMTTIRARGPWIVGGTVAVLLVAGGAVWWSRATANEQPKHARTSNANAPGMADMPGMQMSSSDTTVGATVRLSADQIRRFGVTFGVVERRELTDDVRAVGIVTVDSSKLVQVAPRFSGFVERLYVNAAGQSVRRGQPLMDVYSPELVAAEQELLVAANLQRTVGHSDIPGVPTGDGTDLVAAARQRLALRDVSGKQIADILRSGRVQRTLTLFAPASGVVLDKNVVQGQAIQAGQMLYTIADLANVWVDTQLREADAASVRTGARALVETSAAPGHPLVGRVRYVYPTLDPQARTVRARVSLANDGNGVSQLRPGMYATVTLASPSRMALTVPASAVVRTGERDLVFIDAGGGTFQPLDVAIGRTAGDFTEVISGLEAGQRVVTSAQFLLDAESNLGDVMRSMVSQGRAMSDMPGMNAGASGSMNDRGADMRDMPGMTSSPAAAPPPRTPRR